MARGLSPIRCTCPSEGGCAVFARGLSSCTLIWGEVLPEDARDEHLGWAQGWALRGYRGMASLYAPLEGQSVRYAIPLVPGEVVILAVCSEDLSTVSGSRSRLRVAKTVPLSQWGRLRRDGDWRTWPGTRGHGKCLSQRRPRQGLG
jgi:hypothetical protein